MPMGMVTMRLVMRVLQRSPDDDRRLSNCRNRGSPSSAHSSHRNQPRRDCCQDVRVVVRECCEGLRSSEEPERDLRADTAEH